MAKNTEIVLLAVRIYRLIGGFQFFFRKCTSEYYSSSTRSRQEKVNIERKDVEKARRSRKTGLYRPTLSRQQIGRRDCQFVGTSRLSCMSNAILTKVYQEDGVKQAANYNQITAK